MRKPENNPTERIGRLLEDVEKLEHYASCLKQLLPGFPYPILENVIIERERRALTLKRVLSNRRTAAKLRFLPKLSPADLTIKGGG